MPHLMLEYQTQYELRRKILYYQKKFPIFEMQTQQTALSCFNLVKNAPLECSNCLLKINQALYTSLWDRVVVQSELFHWRVFLERKIVTLMPNQFSHWSKTILISPIFEGFTSDIDDVNVETGKAYWRWAVRMRLFAKYLPTNVLSHKIFGTCNFWCGILIFIQFLFLDSYPSLPSIEVPFVHKLLSTMSPK